MISPVQCLKNHAKEGQFLIQRLKHAETRSDCARWVCDLRRWHRDLWPLTEACGINLGIDGNYYPTEREALPIIRPLIVAPRVVNRHGTITEAQRIMLVMTAAALCRLAPHLANAAPIPPKLKGGAPSKDPEPRIQAIRDELHAQKRRGERRNKQRAIETVLMNEGFEIGTNDFERARERLRKRSF